jgi:hypothetical protein
MTGKERLRRALCHEEAAVPLDLGSASVTGVHVSLVEQLREHYGLPREPVKVHEPYQMLGLLEEDLKEAMGVDVDGIYPLTTMFGFPLGDWKEWRAPWGQDLLVPRDFNVTYDERGDCYIHPRGDTSAPPSGRMPKESYFFDAIIRQPRFDEAELDPEDNLEEFGPVTEEALEHFRLSLVAAESHSRGILANFGGTGIGDIAKVPALGLKYPRGIRDIEEWYVSTITRQDYLHTVFERQTDIALENLERIHAVVGDVLDVAFICGTDFGTQESTFCSPATFDALYKPYYRKLNDWVHRNTRWKTMKHTDGAVFEFIPHFLEAGFDILNPIQISAHGMEPKRLKEEFGDELVFWGAGVDSQHTLPFGTTQEVRDEVLTHCELFVRGGGYVFNTIHNIQAKTPVENVVAMVEALHDFNGRHP